jgi:hypothetical protein
VEFKMTLLCKCCKQEARWCGEGKNSCGIPDCCHIHCDHCGMHYTLENEEIQNAHSYVEAKKIMLSVYNKND